MQSRPYWYRYHPHRYRYHPHLRQQVWKQAISHWKFLFFRNSSLLSLSQKRPPNPPPPRTRLPRPAQPLRSRIQHEVATVPESYNLRRSFCPTWRRCGFTLSFSSKGDLRYLKTEAGTSAASVSSTTGKTCPDSNTGRATNASPDVLRY